MTFKLGNQEFNNSKEVRKYFKDLLYNSPLDERLEGEDLELFLTLLSYYTEGHYDSLKSGVHYVTVSKKDDAYCYPSAYPRFFVQCFDGSEFTFPYTKACKSFVDSYDFVTRPSFISTTPNIENISDYSIRINRQYFVSSLDNLFTLTSSSTATSSEDRSEKKA